MERRELFKFLIAAPAVTIIRPGEPVVTVNIASARDDLSPAHVRAIIEKINEQISDRAPRLT